MASTEWFGFQARVAVSLCLLCACGVANKDSIKTRNTAPSGPSVSTEERDAVLSAYYLDRRPSVTAVTPPNGGTLALGSQSVVIEFSEPMDPNSFADGDGVVLADEADRLLPHTLTVGTSLLILSPNEPLAGGKRYKLTVLARVLDKNGQSLADPFTSSFSVEAAPVDPPAEVPVAAVTSFTSLDTTAGTTLSWTVTHHAQVRSLVVARSFNAVPTQPSEGDILYVDDAPSSDSGALLDTDRLHQQSHYALFVRRLDGTLLPVASTSVTREFPLRISLTDSVTQCTTLRGEVYSFTDETFLQPLQSVQVVTEASVNANLVFTGLLPDQYRVVAWRDCAPNNNHPGASERSALITTNNLACTGACATSALQPRVEGDSPELYTIDEMRRRGRCGGRRLEGRWRLYDNADATNRPSMVQLRGPSTSAAMSDDGSCAAGYDNRSFSFDRVAADQHYTGGFAEVDAVAGEHLFVALRAGHWLVREPLTMSQLWWLDLPKVLETSPTDLIANATPAGSTWLVPSIYPDSLPSRQMLERVVLSRVENSSHQKFSTRIGREAVDNLISGGETIATPPSGETVGPFGQLSYPFLDLFGPEFVILIEPEAYRVEGARVVARSVGLTHPIWTSTTSSSPPFVSVTADLELNRVTGESESLATAGAAYCPDFTLEGVWVGTSSCSYEGCSREAPELFSELSHSYPTSRLQHARYFSYAELAGLPVPFKPSVAVKANGARDGELFTVGDFVDSAGRRYLRDFFFLSGSGGVIPAGSTTNVDVGTSYVFCPQHGTEDFPSP